MKRSVDGKFSSVNKCCNRSHSHRVCTHTVEENTSAAESKGTATGEHRGAVSVSSANAACLQSNFVALSKLPAPSKSEFIKENKWFLKVAPKRHHSYFVCEACYKHFSRVVTGTSTSASTSHTSGSGTETESETASEQQQQSTHNDSRVNSILEELSKCSEFELGKIAESIAGSQINNIKRDIQKLLESNKNLETLCEGDVGEWLNNRNTVIRKFLEGLRGEHTTESEIAKAIEHIYHLGNSKAVLPLCLRENLVQYSVTGSRTACQINSANSPAGGYNYLTTWLREQSLEQQSLPVGDIIVAFDNDQIIGKSYHVRFDNKVKTSVITSVCFAEVDPKGTLQRDSKFKPANWQTSKQISEQVPDILSADSTLNNAADQTHYKELYATLATRITKVTSEQSVAAESIEDEIDAEVKIIREKREWKICSQCDSKNLKNKRVCVSCGSKLRLPTEDPISEQLKPTKSRDSSSFLHVKFQDSSASRQDSSGTVTNIIAGDPIFVNPNSHESLIRVFKDIGKQVGIRKYVEDGVREWVAITCDGLPYTIGQRVLKETFSCLHCSVSVFTRKAFLTHLEEHSSHGEQNVDFPLEFDWLLLKIGHGHVEMNMVRSFFELNWDVFIKDLALCMGFRSEAAQSYAKRGSDHHKSWELLQIAFLGCIDELLVPYIRDCLQAESEPTPHGFLEWSAGIKSKRFMYMQEQILTYAQAIFNLRAGIRHNDMSRVIAGRVKFANIFHARNHPKYQLIEMAELCNFLAAPKEVKNFLTQFQAVSASGDPTRCEDMDFVLENINKKSKAWVPKGVPTHADWQRIFRNLSKLDKLRSAVLSKTALSTDSQCSEMYTSSHQAREEDVCAWRVHLRDSGFLLQQDSDVPFQSVSKGELHESLLTLTKQATDRRKYFAQTNFMDGGSSANRDGEGPAEKPQLVYVTCEEEERHNSICNQTKSVIAQRVLENIGTIDDDSIKSMLLQEWDSSVKTGKKEDYIAFYQRVLEEMNHQTEAREADPE